jgi:NADPH-dependent 2,4-dienoyl-CoA reductase/sulfur reductase-like enzyme
MGRALLADPHLPQKAFEGKEEEIRPCIGCNEGCYKRIFQQLDIQCSVNPTLGREGELSFDKASKPKKVFIFGGGPAGLEAAHAAWERGHQVVLMEKSKALGGQLNLASIPPGRKEIERFKNFLLNRLKKTDVKVITGEKAISSFIKKGHPEVFILATGAHPRSQDIPGLEKACTTTAWEILSGEKDPKGPCLVLGGGLVGCETADYLSEKGEKVILVEILPEIATGSDADTKTYFSLKFQKNAVKVYTDTELRRVDRKTAILQKGNEEIKIQVETVVFAVGAEPNDGLYNELISSGSSVIKVGDCVKPRTLLEAVQEGFKAGRAI